MDTPQLRMFLLGGGDPYDDTYVEALLSKAFCDYVNRLASFKAVVVPTACTTQADFDRVKAWAAGFFGANTSAEVSGRWSILHKFGQPAVPTVSFEMIRRADVIYVPGGNTVAAVRSWREWNILESLTQAIESGTLVMGSAATWFEMVYVRSPGQNRKHHVQPGVGLLPSWCCERADFGRGPRRNAFVQELESRPEHHRGIAVDGAAALDIRNGIVTIAGQGQVTVHHWFPNGLDKFTYQEGSRFSLSIL